MTNPDHEVLDHREPILSHVHELLRRMKRALVFFVLAFGFGYASSETVLKWIMIPIKAYLPEGSKLVYTQPFEQVFVLMKMSLVIATVVSLPMFFLEIFYFLKRGLKRKEAFRVWTTCVGAWVLGILGIYWSYHQLLPKILSIVLSYQTLDVSPVISLSYYVNASLGLLLVGALFFEIPFVMILTSLWGWVSPDFWSRSRRYAIVVNAVVSAILSPPDLPSMLVMMVPVQVLYEIGHLGARFLGSKKEKN